ncbi:NACHT domain-containing protein [Kitasatospora sp. P5_F3]
MSLETDDAVDDVRIDFELGLRALVQAKRRLVAGKPLTEAVAQWVQAAKAGLDPTKDRLVIVAGSLSRPMKDLQRVLNRERTDHPGTPTGAEASILSRVRALLGDLDEPRRDLVLSCAVIWELRVEEPDDPDSQQAMNHLRHVVADGGHDMARRAWEALMKSSGRTARLRGGHKLVSWLNALQGEGIEISSAGAAPAAVLETRRQTLERYIARLDREGTEVDLSSLGAELPKLSMSQADAGISVGTNPDDDRADSELIWAFLRRGRVVLTGLPGGGKSTALKRLAAQLASDETFPLPVRASLREINTADRQTSFRDRLIAVAVRDDRPADRAVLTREINERLDRDGGIALLLDSLDETYDQRAKVVSEIATLAADLPEGVCVLLATRDVAYGQAATLNWPALRLRPPSSIKSTVTAVLEMAASQKVPEAADRSGWVAEREEWVLSALEQDELLRETPLIPVLLALLAVRRSAQTLPKLRAKILEAVVKDVVASRELKRGDGRTLGPLVGNELSIMQAFTSEAAEILNSQGRATAESIVNAIAADLREPWGLAPAQATTAGWEAVRLFDETGIFVLSGADETVAPRIALFAEIGDALRIISRPDEIARWVDERIASQQFEPLVLACTLDTAVATAAASALQRNPGHASLARALVQAAREGAELDDSTIRQVCECLIAQVADGTQEGWQSWEDLLWLPIPAELRAAAEAASMQHGPEHALVARASLDLHFRSNSSSVGNPQILKDVLVLQSLPRLPSSNTSGILSLKELLADDILTRTRENAAEFLLDHVPGSAPLVADCAAEAPSGLRGSLMKLLLDRGFNDDVRALREVMAQETRSLQFPSWFPDLGPSVYAHFLRLVAGHATAELSMAQATVLDELADFVETMYMNDGGVSHLHKQPDGILQELIGVTASLYGFDHAVLAAQAKIALVRMEHWNDNVPYFALFDNAHAHSNPDWSGVHDREAAVRLLVLLFPLGIGQARFAARSLWEAPVADQAAPLLRALLPRLVQSPRHERIGAATLASLASGPEPECWVASDDPVLRAVAATMIEPMSGDALSNQLRELLDDPDGHVQVAAINHIVSVQPPDLIATLNRVAGRPAPGWMCLSCRTVNPPPGRTSCSNEKCFSVGADPAKLASESLQKAVAPGAH